MKRSSPTTRPMAEINVVPYIDVMLVLLVIFMITAPLLTQGVSVDLPQTRSEAISGNDREPLIVSVDKNGDYFLNVNATPELALTARELVLRVAAELQIARESHESTSVLVKGDKGVPYGKVVAAMALLKQAGAEKVGLVTQDVEEHL